MGNISTLDGDTVSLEPCKRNGFAPTNLRPSRVAHITGTSGGLNGTVFLKSPAISRDTSADVLTRGSCLDLFLLNSTGKGTIDKAADRSANETWNDIA